MKLKKLLAGFMTVCMLVTAVSVTAMAEGTEVAKIGETSYATLKAAVEEANNAEDGATIELLSDVALSEKLTINKKITISGAHTITRGIADTIFAVGSNATLTLDGGVIIDGGNDWTFDSENFYADLAAAKTLSTGAKDSYSTSAEGGLVSTAAMITISGTNGAVVMNGATIQNNWGSQLFSVPAGAKLTMNEGALIQDIRGSVAGQIKGVWTMHNGKITGVHGHNTNGCLTDIRGGTFTINGGEICNNTLLGLNNNGSGILAQVYGTSSKLVVNGGNIHDNANFCPGGGWGSIVYLNRGGNFEMNGGTIGNGNSDRCTTIGVNDPGSTVKLNAGTINVAKATAGTYDSLLFGNVTIGTGMTISGGDVRFCGTKDNTLVINGTVNSNMLLRAENVENNGVVNGNVTITKDSWVGNNGSVTISGGTWNGEFTVTEGASLQITGGIFKQNVSQWVAADFGLIDNGDGTYGVAKQEEIEKLVARVGSEYFETLKEAVEAANGVEGGATVTLLQNVTLGEKLIVSGDVKIEGEHTITRADNYTGTLFTVSAGAALTLDGGLVIDGGNEYVFDKDAHMTDVMNRTKVAKEDSAKWFTPEEGAPVASAFMITTTGGTVNLNKVTIQNNYSIGSGIVSVGANSTVNLTDAKITHCAATQGNGVAVNASGAGIKVNMNEGTVIDANHVGGNHGIFKIYSGTVFTMNGGEITNNTGWNSNGTVVGIYWGTFEMNGGRICSNAGVYGPSNGRNAAIYGHTRHVFIMNGGVICHNTGGGYGGLDAPYDNGVTEITGGSIVDNVSASGNSKPDVNGTSVMQITGGTFTQDISTWLEEGGAMVYDAEEGVYKAYSAEDVANGTFKLEAGDSIVINDGKDAVTDGDGNIIEEDVPNTKIEVGSGSATVNPDGSISVDENTTLIVGDKEVFFPNGGTIDEEGNVKYEPAPSTSSKKSTKKYAVSIDADEVEKGTIKLSPSKAKKGATVTITAIPDAGYELDKLVVLDKDGNEVELKDKGDGKFTFKMPRGGVEVDASFAEADAVVAKDTAKIVLTIDSIVALVDGEPVVNDVAPIIKGERTFLPIRLIAEELGATVTWNEAEQSVTIVKDDMTIVIYIGQAFALVNGEPVQLDAPAFIQNDRTYLPVRFISENLGAVVTWDDTAKTVTIVG